MGKGGSVFGPKLALKKRAKNCMSFQKMIYNKKSALDATNAQLFFLGDDLFEGVL